MKISCDVAPIQAEVNSALLVIPTLEVEFRVLKREGDPTGGTVYFGALKLALPIRLQQELIALQRSGEPSRLTISNESFEDWVLPQRKGLLDFATDKAFSLQYLEGLLRDAFIAGGGRG